MKSMVDLAGEDLGAQIERSALKVLHKLWMLPGFDRKSSHALARLVISNGAGKIQVFADATSEMDEALRQFDIASRGRLHRLSSWVRGISRSDLEHLRDECHTAHTLLVSQARGR